MSQFFYYTVTPTTGNTVTAPDWAEVMSLTPAGTLATLTVNPPKQPHDGQPFFLASSQIITTLTMSAVSGTNQTIVAAPSSLAVGVGFRWVFNANTNTWMIS